MLDDWFEWNGVKCTDYGMTVLAFPSIVKASERVSYRESPGLSGSLTQKEGEHVYDDVVLACTCIIDDPYELVEGTTVSRIQKICGWLLGDGTLKFADRPEGFYLGRVTNQISFDTIVRANPHRSFQVQFRCRPFFRLTSGLTTRSTTGASLALTNLGNIPAKPLLRLAGTGEGTVMCGDSTMLINNLSGISYLMLDCEAEYAYKGALGNPVDPLVSLNSRVDRTDWLEIPTGASFLTISGGISSAILTPRWWTV